MGVRCRKEGKEEEEEEEEREIETDYDVGDDEVRKERRERTALRAEGRVFGQGHNNHERWHEGDLCRMPYPVTSWIPNFLTV